MRTFLFCILPLVLEAQGRWTARTVKRLPQTVRDTPLWVRLTAVWCVLLCFGVALVQASHDHGGAGKPAYGSSVHALSENGGGGDLCPFCVGMHLCPPRLGTDLAFRQPLRARELKVQAILVASAPLPFDLSSRPPPSHDASRAYWTDTRRSP